MQTRRILWKSYFSFKNSRGRKIVKCFLFLILAIKLQYKISSRSFFLFKHCKYKTLLISYLYVYIYENLEQVLFLKQVT
jgi:hypothetical protein